ncbi:MAG TPA: protein-L-isoaspartate(D-aspartate) O-methyltransferase [Thermoplasmata archaeon]|nr:protein-L-isoaspartate(D-aspartate) O-methyltransferase [Thermoplasmata archaeon]
MGRDLALEKRRRIDRLVADGDVRTAAVRAAFEKVPRELFLTEDLVSRAYADTPLPIAAGQTISAPSMIAIMLEEAALVPGLNVLEIGAGSGYNAALLAELVGGENVVSIERHPELVDLAKANLQRAGYKVEVVRGDGSLGHTARAPYDRIVATAGAPRLASSWVEQLRIGGRIVAPIGGSAFRQVLVIAEKRPDGSIVRREGVECAFVPLVGKEAWRA